MPSLGRRKQKVKGGYKAAVYLLQLSCVRGSACRGKGVRGLCRAEHGEITAAVTTFTVALPRTVTYSSVSILL